MRMGSVVLPGFQAKKYSGPGRSRLEDVLTRVAAGKHSHAGAGSLRTVLLPRAGLWYISDAVRKHLSN